jgi:hypothetical protein
MTRGALKTMTKQNKMGYGSHVWKLELLRWKDRIVSNVIYEIIISFRKEIN